MTINKSQGQTFDKVGIYLPNCVFSHGQLYVAFSRGKQSCDVKIKIDPGPNQRKLVEDLHQKRCIQGNILSTIIVCS